MTLFYMRKTYPAGKYVFKVNNRNTKRTCQTCSKLTISIPERRCWRYWRLSSIFPANIRLDEDVLKTSWRHLSSSSSEDVFKTSSRRLDQDEYVRLSLTSSENVFKTFSSRLGQDQYIRFGHTSLRSFQDVFKTSSRRLANTSSRHLQDVFKTSSRRLDKRLQDIFKTSCKDIFKMFSRRIIKLNCSC